MAEEGPFGTQVGGKVSGGAYASPRCAARAPSSASSVCTARPLSLENAAAKSTSAKPRPSASAARTPSSVSGVSHQPCTLPMTLNSVWPWRTT